MIEAPINTRRVPVAEAAAILGVSVDTIKRRIRRGTLQCSRTAQGRVLVELPEAGAAPQPPEAAPQADPSAPQDAPHVQCNDAEHVTLTTERDWLRERVERGESEREQLRILLSNAQQSLVRALQAAPHPAPQAPTAASGSTETPELSAEPGPSPDLLPVAAPPHPNAAPGWRAWAAWLVGLLIAVGALLAWPW